jgi:nucleoporin p58/p45
MGQSTNQQQQQVIPGVRIDLSNLKGTTRFNDLQEDLQNELIKCDAMIQRCMEQKNQVEAFMPAHGEALEAIPNDVRFVSRKYDGADSALAADAQSISGLRDLGKVDVNNAKLVHQAVENLKLPPQFHTSGLWSSRQQEGGASGSDGNESSSDLINFFSKTGDEMDEQLKRFEKNLGEIELHLHGVEAGLTAQIQRVQASNPSTQGGSDQKLAELAAVLRDFEESIMSVAGVVGGAREGMTALQRGAFLGNGSGLR